MRYAARNTEGGARCEAAQREKGEPDRAWFGFGMLNRTQKKETGKKERKKEARKEMQKNGKEETK